MLRVIRTLLATAVGAVLLAGVPIAASAHHSHAMYDTTKVLTVKGDVKSYNFANPHVYLFLTVKQPNGKTATYAVEASYTQNMERDGIGPATFKAGDKVTVFVNPLRSGTMGGSYVGAIDAQGHKHGRYFKDQNAASRD